MAIATVVVVEENNMFFCLAIFLKRGEDKGI
jgi:hypothetical protein